MRGVLFAARAGSLRSLRTLAARPTDTLKPHWLQLVQGHCLVCGSRRLTVCLRLAQAHCLVCDSRRLTTFAPNARRPADRPADAALSQPRRLTTFAPNAHRPAERPAHGALTQLALTSVRVDSARSLRTARCLADGPAHAALTPARRGRFTASAQPCDTPSTGPRSLWMTGARAPPPLGVDDQE